MPKGVLWRQADIFVGALGGRRNDGAPVDELRRRSSQVRRGTERRAARPARSAVHARRRPLDGFLTLPPRQHRLHPDASPSGSTPPTSGASSSARRSRSCSSSATPSPARCSTSSTAATYDLSSLTVLLSGGAPLSAPLKERVPRPPARRSSSSTASARPRRAARCSTCPPGGAASTGHVHAVGRATIVLSADLTARARRGRRRDRLARPDGPARRSATSATRTRPPAPSRSSTACATRCPATGPGCGRRHDRRAARPRLGHHQLRRREDLRRGGRAGARATTPTCTTSSSPAGRRERWGQEVVAIVQLRDGVEPPTTRGRAARRERDAHRPLQAARRRSSSSTRSCARRRARPTTAGRARPPPADPTLSLRRETVSFGGHDRARHGAVDHLVRDLLEVMILVRGDRHAGVGRSYGCDAARSDVVRCQECGRPTSRAYPNCKHCGAVRGRADRQPTAAPAGRGEDPRRAGDVRRHRAPLRPRQPDHDVPDGRRLAASARSTTSRCRAARSCSTSLRAPATCAASCTPAASSRSASTSPRGCCAPIAAACRWSSPTCCSSRSATRDVDGVTCGFALRNLRELAAFFAELARVVRVGGRVALLEVATPDNPVMRWGHGIYFGHVVPGHRRVALGRRRLPLPPPLGGLPARARRARRDVPLRRGSPTLERPTLSGGIAQLLTGTRR